VPIHASGEHDGRPYFVMAYVEGASLREVVQHDGLPAPRATVALLRAVTDAVHYAHGHGIIHRDLKPENVLIDPHGRPRVTDFGIAKRLDRDAGLTADGQVLGTPGYMAPEQALGRHEDVCPATDVYSLGGILYFLLTGRPPFQGRTITDTLCQVATTPPTPPREVNPQAPAALEAVALKCLEKEPVNRYPNAQAFLEALRAALPEDGPSSSSDTELVNVLAAAPVPPSPATPAWAAAAAARAPGKWRVRRMEWLGPAAALLVGLGVGAWLSSDHWWPGRSGEEPAPLVARAPEHQGAAPESPDPKAEQPKEPVVPAEKVPALKPLPLPEKMRSDFGLEVELIGGRPGEDGVRQLVAEEVVKFKVKVDRDAYVGVWSVNGNGTLSQLFPNENEKDHLFKAGQARLVPLTEAEATPSTGTDHIWVQASTKPWDPDEGERVGPFLLFQTQRQREQWARSRRDIRLRPAGTLSEAVLPFRVSPR
jgi:hypothetical protein